VIIKKIKGTHDLLPDETATWVAIEEKARELFRRFGFEEIRPPLMEWTELFARGIGEATDIVGKEMYSFQDTQGRSISLRPEATVGVLRAFLENGLYTTREEYKLFTIGPMFRHERPQKGRYRQFHQINAEIFGNPGPRVDVELIAMLHNFLSAVELKDTELVINSLGCADCRPSFRIELRDFLESRRPELCVDCQRRIDVNPLRVLDCKVLECREAVLSAPSILKHLCAACKVHFQGVKEGLEQFGVGYRVNERLVRGLDYYTRTTFEAITGKLGSQDAVAGGGRYDRLSEILGGPSIPAIGFAMGMERLAVLSGLKVSIKGPDLYLAPLGEEPLAFAFSLAHHLRINGLAVELAHTDKSLKSQLRRADKLGARGVLIIGEKELANRSGILRNMSGGQQEEIDLDTPPHKLAAYLKSRR
jgi:histidyl-tRNA synthetase